MKSVVNFGSLNIDHVYAVEHFVRPGETLAGTGYQRFSGGKGLNQSVALARAGATVRHAGRIGRDGVWLKERLDGWGVDTSLIEVGEVPTGHAIIQVTPEGENAILLYGGANRAVDSRDLDRVLSAARPGELLLLQNEISAIPEILERGSEAGLTLAFNPAPMTPDVPNLPLDKLRYLIVNEIEGGDLTGETDPRRMLDSLCHRCPATCIVLTLGAEGVLCAERQLRLRVPAVRVTPVDTTAAGDTFIGYFLASIIGAADLDAALRIACRAAAICVSRPGAADSIPTRAEVDRL